MISWKKHYLVYQICSDSTSKPWLMGTLMMPCHSWNILEQTKGTPIGHFLKLQVMKMPMLLKTIPLCPKHRCRVVSVIQVPLPTHGGSLNSPLSSMSCELVKEPQLSLEKWVLHVPKENTEGWCWGPTGWHFWGWWFLFSTCNIVELFSPLKF